MTSTPDSAKVTDPEFARALLANLVGGTRTSNSLPSTEDGYATAFSGYNASMAAMGSRLSGMMQGFMDQHQVPTTGAIDDVSARFDSVVELSDRLLDRVDHDLDRHEVVQMAAQQRALQLAAGTRVSSVALQLTSARHSAPAAGTAPASNMVANKPQQRWRDEVDNSSRPFVPKLRSKPNAILPLELRLEQPDESGRDLSPLSALGTAASSARPQPAAWYANPYTPEINAFVPSEEQLSSGREQLYMPLHATPCTWVDTNAALQQLRARLVTVSEFAIDLECHAFRTYRGFVCLMQISTREEDFLIDTLELRSSLHVLNDSFTDPRIAKVMHGADSDVIWLQRDFGLYLVGLFDSGQAMRVLEFQSFALAHLLKHYCGVTANKSLQMADWRLRPLTDEMATYAREDTHYLLYIYDRMRADLAPSGRCLAVWQRSAELCRQAYKTPQFDPDGHTTLARRQNVQLNSSQMAVLQALYAWRDVFAREEDESPDYVLPKHQLFRLATGMPQTPEQLHAVCHPLPPLLQYRATSLLTTIRNAMVETAPADKVPQPSPQVSASPRAFAGNPSSGGIAGNACPVLLSSSAGMAPTHLPTHPMQPSLNAHAASFNALPSEMPSLAVCSSPMLTAGSAGPPSASHSLSASAGGRLASGRSVRCPPAPTRSPPLPLEHVFTAAGWVGNGLEELTRALLPGGRDRNAASLSDANCGVFVDWSEGSSGDDDDVGEPLEEGEDARTARSVERHLTSSSLWVLSMFAPAAHGAGPAAASNADSGSLATGERDEEHAVPRSLNEIYKLSNQNKRRGAAIRRPSEEVPQDLEDSKADGEISSEGDEEFQPFDEEEEELDEDEADGSKRPRATEEASWIAEPSDTEDFMRRIGWLRPDAEMPTGSESSPADFVRANGIGSCSLRPSEGLELGFGSGGLQAGDPPPLPFQRQLPPHMPGRLGGGPSGGTEQAPVSIASPMGSAPQQPALAQLLAPRPNSQQPSSGSPSHSDAQEMSDKKARARPHKRGTRAGGAFGSGEGGAGFDYDAAAVNAPFVYSMSNAQGGSNGAPPRGPTHGGKGTGGGAGAGGGKRQPPPSSGNRSMSFAPSGPMQGKGGGGRRY